MAVSLYAGGKYITIRPGSLKLAVRKLHISMFCACVCVCVCEREREGERERINSHQSVTCILTSHSDHEISCAFLQQDSATSYTTNNYMRCLESNW